VDGQVGASRRYWHSRPFVFSLLSCCPAVLLSCCRGERVAEVDGVSVATVNVACAGISLP